MCSPSVLKERRTWSPSFCRRLVSTEQVKNGPSVFVTSRRRGRHGLVWSEGGPPLPLVPFLSLFKVSPPLFFFAST